MKYTIGHKIKTARKYRNMSQKELAKKSGLTETCIFFLETERRNDALLSTVYKIAKATKVKLTWFMKNLKME